MLSTTTSNRNSTWIEGGKLGGCGQKWKMGTFFQDVIANRSENPEMTVICFSRESVVNWPVEVFYQHDSKDLSSLLKICVEFEVWPRERFDYRAVKIL